MPRYAHFQLHVLHLLDSFTCFGSSPFKNTFLSSDWMPLTLEGLNSTWVPSFLTAFNYDFIY